MEIKSTERWIQNKAWFRRYVFLMWKKEHVEMCICGFVFQRYGKSTYGFRMFRHLSCSVCIILTYSLENGERGHVAGSKDELRFGRICAHD